MLFPEEDSPVLKEWIVKRLENTFVMPAPLCLYSRLVLEAVMLTNSSISSRSDADADVLADYVLALLHNANDGDNIQGVFEEEITPFLKEGACSTEPPIMRSLC